MFFPIVKFRNLACFMYKLDKKWKGYLEVVVLAGWTGRLKTYIHSLPHTHTPAQTHAHTRTYFWIGNIWCQWSMSIHSMSMSIHWVPLPDKEEQTQRTIPFLDWRPNQTDQFRLTNLGWPTQQLGSSNIRGVQSNSESDIKVCPTNTNRKSNRNLIIIA